MENGPMVHVSATMSKRVWQSIEEGTSDQILEYRRDGDAELVVIAQAIEDIEWVVTDQ